MPLKSPRKPSSANLHAVGWPLPVLALSSSSSNGFSRRIPFEVVGVICESDSGLAMAEKLTQWLGLDGERGNCEMHARRDKHLMARVVADAGIKGTVKGKICTSQGEACACASSLGVLDSTDESYVLHGSPASCIVKPRRGVASEMVFKCDNLQEVADASEAIIKSKVFGEFRYHNDCMVQEYIDGIELAVDTVSRNGEVKVTAIWSYDKRAVNGAPFVYFSTSLVDGSFKGPHLEGQGSKRRGDKEGDFFVNLDDVPNNLNHMVYQKVCEYVKVRCWRRQQQQQQ